MKKAMILMLASVFVVGSLSLIACGNDDDDNGGGSGPCDQLAKAWMDCIDEVCDDFPDCSICDPAEEGEGETPTDEECQDLLDEFDHDDCLDLFTMVCEMEEDAE